MPGETYRDRLAAMGSADMAWWISLAPMIPRFNAFLAQVAATVRQHFTGRGKPVVVTEFTDLMDIFETEGVDTAFWFTFASYTRTGEDDLGSYGVVRVTDEAHWDRKQVFSALAERLVAAQAG